MMQLEVEQLCQLNEIKNSKSFLSVAALSRDCFVKLGLSDKNIFFCPTFRLEQKSTVDNVRLKNS
jgi:hypothetical protein